ncbi:uncharacterized protein LOC127804705 isoform X2 [Diospyros lotus]|uniref:uncharacterized protein LOC127804705 isoform X2 n=1 Tax=Diospyros lotus TaxID=55363 RepID=UPI00224C9360|nr:uncharacterized protein LOC127804705 isoform X2 [Diospyros lotus]
MDCSESASECRFIFVSMEFQFSTGFEAYLVGGCVRDLLLNKIPKDFDVITTATLKRIRQEFRRCEIVGRRFPICRVHIKGSVVEVSSFETAVKTKNSKEKEECQFSQMPHGCDRKDFVIWRDCMGRDFTINSLFFDPFVNKIYDYANGMVDLQSLKLRTLIPAQLSFKEDCARILRGLRIAARLGLSFSKETEFAIRKLSSSIATLPQCRIMMELNYMLSYGAAEPSLCLLQRFNLLEVLLPFHAAYLAQQACRKSHQGSIMLMKLFFNLDKLVTCDQPSDCSLWVGLLAFHLALVNNPQNALVVWTFASVLYHQIWKDGVKFARENVQAPIDFSPEISDNCNFISDDELAERVSQFATMVQESVGALTETEILLQLMSRFPDYPCPGLVFISKKSGKDAALLFRMLVHNAKSLTKRRNCPDINYNLLGKGDVWETRFVLGKIIMNAMSSGAVQESKVVEEEKDPGQALGINQDPLTSNIEVHHIVKDNKKRNSSPSSAEHPQARAKKQKSVGETLNLLDDGRTKKKKAVANRNTEKRAKQQQEMIEKHLKMLEGEHNESQEVRNTPANSVEKCHSDRTKQQKGVLESKQRKTITKKSDKHKTDVTEKQQDMPLRVLSGLFR